jgi:hypothetical protein
MSCLDAAFAGDTTQLRAFGAEALQGSDLFLRNAMFYAACGGHLETVRLF